jgi:hypothetical protein
MRNGYQANIAAETSAQEEPQADQPPPETVAHAAGFPIVGIGASVHEATDGMPVQPTRCNEYVLHR